jgi:mono/diheme cytochrome c family protein
MAMAGLLAGHAALAGDAAGRSPTAAEPSRLKPGAGEEATMATCSACHTPDYVIMNSVFLTPDAWKAEVNKMRSAFGAPIDDETAAEITGYLAKNYAVTTQKP